MTSPPISTADRERTTAELVEVIRDHAAPGSPAFLLAARVVELEAALAKYRCPLGMENGSTTCSAGSCPECLAARIYAGWHQLNASDARATALLEALQAINACMSRPNPTDPSHIHVARGQRRAFQAAMQVAEALVNQHES